MIKAKPTSVILSEILDKELTMTKEAEYIQRDIEETYRIQSMLYNGVHGYLTIPELNGRSLTIKDVIFNDPATIVFWSDGTKTVVKAVNEDFDKEKGLAMAVTKKFFGNKGNYYNNMKKWLD